MKFEQKGWVVINPDHPAKTPPMMVGSTFAWTRSESIALFVQDSEHTWDYWKRKFNYRCVKATKIIEV